MAPSHVRERQCYYNRLHLWFSFRIFCKPKLEKVEEIIGTGMQEGEVEPEGELLVGSEGEALRPPGIIMVFSSTLFMTTVSCKYLGTRLLVVFVCIEKLLSSLGELVEDEGKGEEPEVCAKEQMEFHWACTWVGDGGMPVLVGGQVQGLICPVFFFSSQPYSLIMIFGSHLPASDLGFNGYLVSSTLLFGMCHCYDRPTPLNRRWSIYDLRVTNWRLKASSE